MKRILTGNQAVAVGALRAGVKVATGYPGTPSTGCLSHLLTLDLPDRHVEWSSNEKVAFEIAAAAAWAGHRALCTMKMSGVNVAYDALISIAYSGTNGGFVIYVADDPGVSAGMPEQDSRGFALMSSLPMLEPATQADAYRLVGKAFELSENVGSPVFVRLTTAVALGHTLVETDDAVPPREIEPILERDITRYTKAGSKICLDQHQALIDRLTQAGDIVHEMGLNQLELAPQPGGIGIIALGPANSYLSEAYALNSANTDRSDTTMLDDVSVLRLATTIPFPWEEVKQLLGHCRKLLVLEELEPHVERGVYVAAQQLGFTGDIIGKLDGTLSPIGEYGIAEVLKGLRGTFDVGETDEPEASDAHRPQELAWPILASDAGAGSPPSATSPNGESSATALSSYIVDAPQERQTAVLASNAEGVAAPRPITVCAGCPHRGTYLAIDQAIQRAGFAKDEVMVTGDIGCTILGMNPPFNLIWNEVSMGSSISLAQGYVHSGVKAPVIATMGDSTFFHGGIPGLINAIQHQVPLTLIVMDNGWTSMTGMQVNAGTDDAFQVEGRRVDIEAVIRGLGPDRVDVVDPFDLEAMTATLTSCLEEPTGVNVVLAQQECAIQAKRRGIVAGHTTIDPDKCILCKRCLKMTGCPALGISSADEMLEEPSPGDFDSSRRPHITIDYSQCNGCGLCVGFCPTNALQWTAGLAETKEGES